MLMQKKSEGIAGDSMTPTTWIPLVQWAREAGLTDTWSWQLYRRLPPDVVRLSPMTSKIEIVQGTPRPVPAARGRKRKQNPSG